MPHRNLATLPYWRLSSFYFFYFALTGAINPYLGLYLTDIGYTAQAIGAVNGVIMGTKIVAPNFWGWLCDRSGHRLRVIAVGSFVGMMTFGGLFYWQSLGAVLLITFLYSFFWNAVLAQFDVVTLQYLNKHSNQYSHIRLWGSVGFIIAVITLGWLFDRIDIDHLIPICWFFFVLIWMSCLLLREPPRQAIQQTASSHWLQLLKKPPVIAFFIAAFLLQFSFGGYYSFFSLHLEAHGYSRTEIGLLWALGVFCEVILFIFMHKILDRVCLSQILFWSLLLTGIRWIVIGLFAGNLAIMIMAQTVHALSFGAAHAVSVEMVRRFFPGANAGQGQALYSSIGFGLGGAVGAVISGFLWDISSALLFVICGVLVFIAAIVIWFGLTREHVNQLT